MRVVKVLEDAKGKGEAWIVSIDPDGPRPRPRTPDQGLENETRRQEEICMLAPVRRGEGSFIVILLVSLMVMVAAVGMRDVHAG